jgi:hypothetical protein
MATYDAIFYDVAAEIGAYGAPSIAITPIAPVVSNVTPTANSTISATQAIGCDITDADGAGTFRRIILTLTLPNGTSEVVHNGSAFVFPYATQSTRSSITNGYRYSIVRDGGWPRGSQIVLTPYAIDTSGEEAS